MNYIYFDVLQLTFFKTVKSKTRMHCETDKFAGIWLKVQLIILCQFKELFQTVNKK